MADDADEPEKKLAKAQERILDLEAKVARQTEQIKEITGQGLRLFMDSVRAEEAADRLRLQLDLAGNPCRRAPVECAELISRTIDPTAWRWIDKVKREDPDHIALPLTLKRLDTQTHAVLGTVLRLKIL